MEPLDGLAELTAKFNGGDWEVRRAALEALGRLRGGRGHAGAIALAGKHLEDEDVHCRRAALSASLRLVLPPPPPQDASEEEATAAFAMRKAAQQSEPATQLLEKVLLRLADQDWGVRRVALGAAGELAQRGDSTVLGALRDHLADPDDDVRGAAVAALGRLAPVGEGTWISILIHHLDDEDETVRSAAVTAVSRVARPENREALAKLTELAREDDDDKVRRAAATARAGLLAAGRPG